MKPSEEQVTKPRKMGSESLQSRLALAERLKSFSKEIALYLFASPAAIGLLSRVNEDFKLPEFLQSAILAYNKTSEKLWELFFGLFPIDLEYDHLLLSFLFILLVPSFIYNRYTSYMYKDEVYILYHEAKWEEVIATFVAFCIFFWLLVSFKYYISSILLIVLILIYKSWIRHGRIMKSLLETNQLPPALIAFQSMSIFSSLFLLLLALTIWAYATIVGRPAFPDGWPNFIAMFLLIPLFLELLEASSRGYKGTYRAGLVFVGVLFSGWIISYAQPAIEQFLNT
jgi:hypothetical protein